MIATVGVRQEVPERADETRWPHVIVHADTPGDALVTVADTVTELLGALIPGYADLLETPEGDVRALEARYDHAVALATALQADLAHQATATGRLDPAAEAEDVLTAIFSDRTEPFTGGHRLAPDAPAWVHDVPLVLIATDYAPFTGRARPAGRIIWLDPSNEATFLSSLEGIGLVRHFTAE